MKARPFALTQKAASLPAPGADQIVFLWNGFEVTQPIVCYLDYTAPERGGFEGGLQVEPDVEEEIKLVAAFANGLDIVSIIEEHRDLVEELALKQLARDRREAVAERVLEAVAA